LLGEQGREREVHVGKVADNSDNMAKCICGECPSKNHDEMSFYCAKGKSTMTVRRRGCVCTDCKIWHDSDLTKGYYCDEGVTE
jgi:hypothetical protein